MTSFTGTRMVNYPILQLCHYIELEDTLIGKVSLLICKLVLSEPVLHDTAKMVDFIVSYGLYLYAVGARH